MSLAIVYARVSTEEQARQGYSLIDQLQECRDKAKQVGATDTMEFSDEGIGGDVLERPGLSRARELIRRGSVAHFICFDPDRLARKLSHQLLITDEIERSGCGLLFVNFNWQNTPEGRLFYSLRGAIAEFEKEKIKERTMRGLRQKAKQGGLTHDPKAYGYVYSQDSNCLEILHKEADVYLMMSKWFLEEQLGYSGIAKRLTSMGIATKRGAPSWAPSTVSRMLVNPLYTGELTLQRYNTVGRKNNKFRPKADRVPVTLRPKEDHIQIEVPAIIDHTTFDLHLRQAAKISRFHKKRPWHGDYLLSGLLRCGICGSPASGTRTRSRRYYRCNASSSCGLPYQRAESMEDAVWGIVSGWLSDPEALLAALRLQAPDTRDKLDHAILQRHLAETLKERERIIDLIQKGFVSLGDAESRLDKLSRRVHSLGSALPQCQEQAGKSSLSFSSPERSKERLILAIASLDHEGKQHAVRQLIEAVHVLPGQLTVVARIGR